MSILRNNYRILLALIAFFGHVLVAYANNHDRVIRLEVKSHNMQTTLGVDEALKLEVYAIYRSGMRKSYPGKVLWDVSNKSTAEIEANGRLVGLSKGQVFVSAYAEQESLSARKVFNIENKSRRIYLKTPWGWNDPHIWLWYMDGSGHPSGVDEHGNALNVVHPRNFVGWPGPSMKRLEGHNGWYYYDMPRYDDKSFFPNQNLSSQPTRVIFNNNGNGEQTRTAYRLGGCFVADGSSQSSGDVTLRGGEWKLYEDCYEIVPRPIQLWAVSSGGPFYSNTLRVKFGVQGSSVSVRKYTLDGTKASKENGITFASGDNYITIGEDMAVGDKATLCLYAETANQKSFDRCFTYEKANKPVVDRLGVQYTKKRSTFSIWSPDNNDVKLWLDGRLLPMGYLPKGSSEYDDVYSISVEGDYHLKPYHFLVGGKIVRDPYAVMAKPGTNFSIVMDLAVTEPDENWAPHPVLLEREDSVVYELHVRDFTIDRSSGVSEGKKGTFAGVVERGTCLNGVGCQTDSRIKTGVDHLLELGVTHVQLLPIFDYGTCSKKDPDNRKGCYNWGYDPENFNVPEERYTSLSQTDYVGRIKELKSMINELHKAGIRVVMDVVYNHTWTRGWREQDEGEQYLSDITNKYFLRSGNRTIDLTGTGNTLDGGHPMVKRYIRDSLEYWAREFRLDGFRFDLAGTFNANDLRDWSVHLHKKFPDRKILMYGEPWTGATDNNSNHLRLSGLAAMQYDSNGNQAHFGGFNDIFRNAIKGDNNHAFPSGYAFNDARSLGVIANGVRGSVQSWNGNIEVSQSIFTTDPEQTINYVSAHDNLTLWDKILAWSKATGTNSNEYLQRINMFASSIVFVSQGIPFMHSGVEMLRTKGGHHNSYNLPDAVNKINWHWKKDNLGLFNFYKNLVAIRKAHPGLRMNTVEEIRQNVKIYSFDETRGFVAIGVQPTSKTNEELLIIINSGPATEYHLPIGVWRVAMRDGYAISPRDEISVSGTVRADGTAVTLLYR